MITISEATQNDIKQIQKIVAITWPITYGEILSKEQLDYMLDLFYSYEALLEQYTKREQLFYMVYEGEANIGFVGIEHHYKENPTTKIHKIYLLPETQGKGIGKKVIEQVEELAVENNSGAISLNVNRFNAALGFYKKIGFEVIGEADIEIGNGYLMEDFVMEKKISN